MPPLQRNARRAVPRRTHRRLQALATTGRVGTVFPNLAGVWSAQRVKIIVLVLSLFIVGTLFEFFNSDLFYVYGFRVTGEQFLTEAEVERASGVSGYNIFFIDARSVEQALRKLPEVKSAHVATGLPNQVAIQVEERVPEITWLRGTDSYWLDQEGIVFRARANLTQLPSIRDLDQAVVKPGQPIQSPAFAAYNGLHAAWPGAPRVFEWSGARGLAYTDEHGWKIYLGDSSEMSGKLAKLRALVPQLVSQNAHVTFIYLRKGDPFYQ
jgi:cell division septal protein FtsQ